MSGFHVDDGAYENYAKQVDPLGDEVRSAAKAYIGPHVTLSGDGFSAIGDESGFAGAYGARMRALQERMHVLGGGWHDVGEAARRTQVNYAAVEQEHGDAVRRLS
ncbi:hypothetical protein ATK30_2325 [Amycolatopsis echigonensis]|uniref:Excreted virulence factor EspC (Type VII ESX diderm) n=1 Tax=Amycolatopsis echigonensis TaxID=2576905 RepID=A0A2N3WCK6_9PSEU|nr:hypothetical protein [Amycolatopsis niigatensis]PKV91549.1 hypothetical protein ATK30_2325 [Amycolatopsis niigatensis]